MTDLETNTVHTGDAIEQLQTLPESSVHTCMTSPPYWNLRDYDHADQLGREETAEEYVEDITDVFDEVRRVLREDGSLWLNLGDTYDEKDLQQIPARVALELQQRGWTLRNRVTWAKPNPMPSSVTDRLNTTTEAIFHLTPSKRYWYDLDAIREPHAEASIKRAEREDARHDHSRRQSVHAEETLNPDQFVHPSGKNPGDVFEVTTKPFPDAHFAVYPPDLCEKPIKATAPPQVCAECGTGYERVDVEEVPAPDANPTRQNAKRAKELADEYGLTDEHKRAIRTVGIHDADYGDAQSMDTTTPEGLAAEAKEALGPYFREYTITVSTETRLEQACDCKTDATESGIVLDPFAGAGTTLLKAKELGRRYVGIELNPEYADMARERVGLALEDPSRARDAEQNGLEQF